MDLVIASLRNPSHTAARILSWRIDRTFDFFVIWLVIIRIFQVGTAISERLASHKNVVNGERMAVLYQQCALQDELVAKVSSSMLSYAYLPILTHLVCHHMLTYQSFHGHREGLSGRRARCSEGASRAEQDAGRPPEADS